LQPVTSQAGGDMSINKWPLCQICGKPVSTKQGILAIYNEELIQYEKQRMEWDKIHPLDKNSGILTPKDIIDMPRLVRWHWGHEGCLHEYIMYHIDYSRFDTIAKALDWTLHLLKKNWLHYTDWEAAVRAHHKASSVMALRGV
jgi:hypothetical protein